MPTHKGKQKKHLEAIAALLQFPTLKEAAEHIGVGEETMVRWLRSPEFQEEYLAARREVVSVAVGNIQHGTSQAAKILVEIMGDTSVRAMTRVAAASKIIDTAFRGLDLEEMSRRIEALEKRIAEIQESNKA